MFGIQSITPQNGAIDVSVDSPITITFTEAVDSASINSFTFSLIDTQSNQRVEGSYTLTDAVTVVFIPSADLDEGVDYSFIISGGNFGIKAADGSYLHDDYVIKFTTFSALEPDSGLPLSEVIAPEVQSSVFEDGAVTLVFNEELDPSTSVVIKSTHFLGRKIKDYWKENVSYSISGSTLTITSQNTNFPLTLENLLKDSSSEILLMDSIPYITYSVNQDGDGNPIDLNVHFDFAVNRIYQITVITPTGSVNVNFNSVKAPMFVSLEEAKLELGEPLVSAFDGDEHIEKLIVLNSERAYLIWTGYGHVFPEIIPYYAKQYVLVRLILQAYDRYKQNNVASGNKESMALGDLKITFNDPTKAGFDILNYDFEKLRELEYILGRFLRHGDVSAKPIYQPSYALMAPDAQSGVIAANPTYGRLDPTIDPKFNRDIPASVPKRGGYNPEID